MAAINLNPHDNDVMVPPGTVKVAKCDIGFSAGDVLLIAQATYALFNVPANTLVLGCASIVTTAFTTSVTLDIGDGTDTDGWLATAKVAPTSAVTTGIFMHTDKATVEAYGGGKLYSAADTIDVVVGGATPAAGVGVVLCKYINDYANM